VISLHGKIAYGRILMSVTPPLNKEEILRLYNQSNGRDLLELAAAERVKTSRNGVELCAIVNAKSGKCSEDCVYCAQSARYKTDITDSPPLNAEEVLSYAVMLEGKGVKRLSLVTSGRGISDRDLGNLLSVYSMLRENTGLSLCASHGLITPEQAKRLKEGGVTRYHHNLETGESYFPNACTTHTYDDRLKTIAIAQDAGLEICSGGLVGLGESIGDRIELAFALQELDVKSIPVNILMPVIGTPLEHNKTISTQDLLRIAALFRCINPAARIRFAAGRPLYDIQTQMESLKYGFDGVMVGNYLTRKGLEIESDINSLLTGGFSILK
jgi:biotin synthase